MHWLVALASIALVATSSGGPLNGRLSFGASFSAADARADNGPQTNCSRLDAADIPPDWMAAMQDGVKLFAERPSELVEAVVHAEGPDGAHGRQLQATTCMPSLANGLWSGSPPGAFLVEKLGRTAVGNVGAQPGCFRRETSHELIEFFFCGAGSRRALSSRLAAARPPSSCLLAEALPSTVKRAASPRFCALVLFHLVPVSLFLLHLSVPPPSACPSADLNAQSFCGYFEWTGSYGVCQTRYLTTSWTGACIDGYYRRAGTVNTGTCTGGKTCCYDPSQGYAGSCTHVCTYNYAPTSCWYCCKCTNVSLTM